MPKPLARRRLTQCKECGARVVWARKSISAEGAHRPLDAPDQDLLDEVITGRPMMPESLKAVIFTGDGDVYITEERSRVLYLRIHRCNR